MSRGFFVKINSYMGTHIFSVRNFTIVVRADTHAHFNKVSCKYAIYLFFIVLSGK